MLAQVISIEPKSASSHEWKLTTSKGSTIYKGIIFAAPLHSSGISISPKQISQQVPPQPYVHLHVTLLATTAPTIRPEYLNLEASGKAPRFLLTTSAGAKAGGKEPEFNSLSYHKKIRDEPGKEEWAVKIFSKEAITDEWLETVFGEGKVGWVYRKVVRGLHYPPYTLRAHTCLSSGMHTPSYLLQPCSPLSS